jgi:hypothetical protein
MNTPYWKEEWLMLIGLLIDEVRKAYRRNKENGRRFYYGLKYRTVEDAARSVLKKDQ